MSASGLRAPPPPAERLASAHVAVLFGGASSEREVSLASGAEVVRALGSDDGRGPRRVQAVELEADGRWRVDGAPLECAAALARLADVDVFFLGLHGGAGEDGTLQGLLESAGRAYTGSGVQASALCMDKLATRGLASACGVRTSAGLCFAPEEVARDALGCARRAQGLGAVGWAVKPRRGGSSVQTFVLGPEEPLRRALEEVATTGDDVLVESRVVGVEVSCGVLGNRGEALRALPPVEIRPAAGRFFDYQQKYSSDGASEVCPPVSLDAEAVKRVQEAALRVVAVVGADGYARVDFIVDGEGQPVLLEVNTLPGFTARSLLPLEAAAAGMDYRGLCLWVLEAALRRHGGAA